MVRKLYKVFSDERTMMRTMMRTMKTLTGTGGVGYQITPDYR